MPTNADQFARELSDLCRKHGIGIAGEPETFVYEPDDRLFDYTMDDRSRLIFGGQKTEPRG